MILVLVGAPAAADPGPMELFSLEPASYSAQTSNEAYPIGNGSLAAMVYGGAPNEIIQFNHDTVWSGGPNDYAHPGASEYLGRIRELIWEGRGEAAYDEVAAEHFMSQPLRQSPYQPTAMLRIDLPEGAVEDYRRTLDLETAIVTVKHRLGEVGVTRECFASHPDGVIVVRLAADRPGGLGFRVSLDSQHPEHRDSFADGDLVLDAQVRDDPRPTRQTKSEVEFRARVRVLPEGGKVTRKGDALVVSEADAATLLLAVGTNFVRFDELGADPELRAEKRIEAAAEHDYASLRERHLADYQPLFRRVKIDLNQSSRASLETAERLKAAGDPAALAEDLQLVALNFQVARYLYLAGSRPGSQPLNLQGKWNNEFDPSWESKMTLNINQEMNYWAVEMANLAECFEPMVGLVRDLSETGAVVAREHYDAPGWMVHHNTDLWRGAAPINSAGGVWPTGAAWLSLHLWGHYRYGGDLDYLREVYPLMRDAARFFADFLVEDPRQPSAENPQWGRYLLTNPSHSPELPNPALGDDGELVAGTSMDSQLIRGLFACVIEASELLGVDSGFRRELATMREKLPPLMVGSKGQLQEWLEDVDVPNTHRHLSHLVALFPADEITLDHTPELAEACRVVLDWKGDATNNTSWSQAWKMCLRNALHEGDHALMILANLFRTSHSDNMIFSIKGGGAPENQVDGNLGAAMGTMMFFLQCVRDEIHLLPALPEAMAEGSVSGLRTPGAFTVGIEWSEGRLQQATLHSARGNDCRIRAAGPIRVLHDGAAVELADLGGGVYAFGTEVGAEYEILPSTSNPGNVER